MHGPGPGDFERTFNSHEDAADAVLEYYFGDPSLMNPPEVLAAIPPKSFREALDRCEDVAGTVCKQAGCDAARIQFSVFCRTHHHEQMTRRLPHDG